MPLIIIAFNVDQVESRFGKFATWIRKRMLADDAQKPSPSNSGTMPVSDLTKIPESSSGEDEKMSVTHTSIVGIASSRSNPVDNGWGLFIFTLKYLFVIFPIDELRFTYRLFSHTESQRSPPSAKQRVEVLVSKDGGVQKTDGVNSKDDHKDQESNCNHNWAPRNGMKRLASGVLSIIRLCMIPVWLCLLFAEGVLFLMVYGVLFPIFKDTPLRKTWEWLVEYIGSKPKGGDLEAGRK